MIPRYQRILYYCFAAGIALLAILLIRGCARDQQRIADMRDQSPITAPQRSAHRAGRSRPRQRRRRHPHQRTGLAAPA